MHCLMHDIHFIQWKRGGGHCEKPTQNNKEDENEDVKMEEDKEKQELHGEVKKKKYVGGVV